jgi:hypothetical protein
MAGKKKDARKTFSTRPLRVHAMFSLLRQQRGNYAGRRQGVLQEAHKKCSLGDHVSASKYCQFQDEEGTTLSTWPAEADQGKRSPIFIEKFIAQKIQDSQITLLGELDFDSKQNYGNANWSLRELANFTFNTPLIKSMITKWGEGKCYYPGIVALWAVSQAQNLEDGTELWTTSNLETTGRTKLAKAFSESIRKLGLETFEGQLEGMQKHMILARLHSVIPNYALDKFTNHIRRGASYHRPPRIILNDILKAQDMSRAIQKLFEEKPELGLDLIDRALQTVRLGKDAGLPPRLSVALNDGANQNRFLSISPAVELPIVALDENSGELYVRGATGWRIEGRGDKKINTEALGCESTFALNDDFEVFNILDVSEGYLLFNLDLELLDSKVLPSRGGVILFNNSIKFDQTLLATEAIDFYSWPGWHMAHFGSQQKLQITLSSGVIRSLSSRQGLEIEENEADYLFTKTKLPIFHAAPVLSSGQVATVIDQRTQERRSIGPDAAPISNRIFGKLDINVYAGLGKSRQFKGLLVPSISLNGDLSPLVNGEVRKLEIHLPPGWQGESTVIIDYDNTGRRSSFRLTDPDKNNHEIFVELPKLFWSIEFQGEVPEKFNINTKFGINRLKQLRRIVVHDLGQLTPKILVRQGSQQTVLKGAPRNQDSLYDMQVIQDSSKKSDVQIVINIAGREVTLFTFLAKDEQPPKPRMQTITNLQDLAAAAVAKGIITEEDWISFEQERNRNSAILRQSLRERRR